LLKITVIVIEFCLTHLVLNKLLGGIMKILIIFLFMFSFLLLGDENFSSLRKNSDAAADRNILTPSAETLNQWDVTINNYEILMTGISLGLTDNLEFSLTVEPFDLGMFMDSFYVGALKYKFFDTGKHLLSLQLVGVYIHKSEHSKEETGDGISAAPLIFLLYDYVVSEKLAFSFSFAGLYLGSSVSYRLFKNFKLFAEVLTIYNPWEDEDAFNYAYGLGFRLFGKNFAFDLSFLGNKIPAAPYFTFNIKF